MIYETSEIGCKKTDVVIKREMKWRGGEESKWLRNGCIAGNIWRYEKVCLEYVLYSRYLACKIRCAGFLK